jgi:chromosome segregation ATPase
MSQTDDSAPLDALRQALRNTAASMSNVTSRAAAPGQDVTALRIIISLDDALEQVAPVADLLAQVSAVAVPGDPVEQHLTSRMSDLGRLRDDVARTRSLHDRLGETEEQHRRLDAEREQLEQRLHDLRAVERRVADLPRMREQERTLADRLKQMSEEFDEADEALLATADQVLLIGRERLAEARDRTRRTLEEVAETESLWAVERRRFLDGNARLLQLRARLEQLDEALDTLPALEEHLRADDELAEALSRSAQRPVAADAEGVRAAFEPVRTLLADVDERLRHMLRTRKQFDEQAGRILSYADEIPDNSTDEGAFDDQN